MDSWILRPGTLRSKERGPDTCVYEEEVCSAAVASCVPRKLLYRDSWAKGCDTALLTLEGGCRIVSGLREAF